jgi:hypothetical protein
MRLWILAVPVMLMGCETPAEVFKGPPKRCMQEPAALPMLKPGDDLVVGYAGLQSQYNAEVSKEKCLQRWTRTVLNRNK